MPEEIVEGERMSSLAEFSTTEDPPEELTPETAEGEAGTPPPPDDTKTVTGEEGGEGEGGGADDGAPADKLDPALEALKKDAEFASAIKERINSLPPEQRQAALVALGLADPPVPKVELGEYEPTGAIEEAIAPHIESIVQLPRFQTDVQEAFDRHAEMLDTVVLENAYLREIVEAMAERDGFAMPAFDAADARKQAYAGKDFRELVKAAAKPARDKAAAIKAQNAKAKPRAVGAASGANGADIESGRLRDYFAVSG